HLQLYLCTVLFNSFAFFLFLPVVFFLYWFVFCKSAERQNILLLAASYVFCGWVDYRFAVILAISTLLNFAFGKAVRPGTGNRRFFLWLSVSVNIGLLAVFRYYDFFATALPQAF